MVIGPQKGRIVHGRGEFDPFPTGTAFPDVIACTTQACSGGRIGVVDPKAIGACTGRACDG